MIHHLPHEALAALLAPIGGVDAVIVDAPYSARTHGGHDSAASSKNEEAGVPGFRTIAYQAWTPEDVARFVEVWHPLTAGWVVSLTDHVLAPHWAAALEAAGRYVFSPIACVEPGSRVRVAGDGPAQWGVWAIVARPAVSRTASGALSPAPTWSLRVKPGRARPRLSWAASRAGSWSGSCATTAGPVTSCATQRAARGPRSGLRWLTGGER